LNEITNSVCSVENCNLPINTKGFCKKHYWQYWKHGKVLDYSVYDKNKIIELDNYAILIICNKKGKITMEVIIDKEDVLKISQYKWHRQAENYVGTILKDQYVLLLHRFIMDATDDMWIDHEDKNRFDCRKNNLRECTGQENCFNRGLQGNNTSGVSGVSWNKNKNKWRSYITITFKRIELGHFKEKYDAIVERLNAEKEYFGEFAPQRHLFEQYNII